MNVPIGIHEQAAGSFDARAKLLEAELSDREPPALPPTGQPPNVYAPRHVVEGTMFEERSDVVGGRGFLRASEPDGSSLGVYGSTYLELRRLAESVQRCRGAEPFLSVRYTRDRIFEWLRLRRSGGGPESMVAFLLESARRDIRELEIWVPVKDVFISASFRLGGVLFLPISQELFAATSAHTAGRSDATPETRDAAVKAIERERMSLQGHTAVVVSVTAEVERANEVAFERATQALAILRLYSSANYRANERSTCSPLGQSPQPERMTMAVQTGRIVQIEKGFDRSKTHWAISTSDMTDFIGMGLGNWSHTLENANRTAFQEDALASAILYSMGALKPDLSDRLVYQFAGLEAILHVDDQESVVTPLSERMAFVLEKTYERRALVVKTVKDAYTLRSKFVHHGEAVDDVVKFEAFAAFGWKFMIALSIEQLKWKTKQDFLGYIERLRLS